MIVEDDEAFYILFLNIPPVMLHDGEIVLVNDGSDEGVHLGHVAAEPEEPAAGSCQGKVHLNHPFVRTRRHEVGKHAPNYAPD